ncbi:hypothetical protein EYC80_003573 [Monilinia laxa]|uniref:Uncharacterized protein n=1 Tax=Monilinia laxa TaxID=61186 RepID=A0A5N6KK50_MONLA|nr:hypothetical protein EYC80_003573 [Monilinia laxa]
MRSPVSDEGSDIEYYVGQSTYESDDKFVIALDFGTTFSGIGYAFVKEDKPDICSIGEWPGLEGRRQPKVPTVICYDPEVEAGFTWGAESHKREIIPGMKLLLDPTQATPVYLPTSSTGKELERLGKPALDVVADFIGAIYKHALTIIEDKIPRDYLEMCQKQFVLSVPEVWSDRAKDLTMKVAKRAKIHPVTLIKEPDAAALYTLHTLKDKALSVGDAFVICDADGGTVDLISYEIMSLVPKLELKELVPGKGGMAGSLGLNKRFEEAVRELVGEYQFHALRKTRGFSSAVEQFDLSVKTAFRGKGDKNYLVDFPMAKLQDDEHRNLSFNCWHLRCDDVKKIFDSLITDIERLVDEQVNLVRVKRMSEDHPKAKEMKGCCT